MTKRHAELTVTAGAAALTIAIGLWMWKRAAGPRRSDDAPGRTARRRDFGGYQVVGRTVTIAAPRSRIYAQWRDPALLNRILGDALAVRQDGTEGFGWTVALPAGEVEIQTRLVEDREDEALAWRSVEDAEIEVEAKVQLRDAPAGRGTEVEAHVAWRPRWGAAGRWAAHLGGTDPETLCSQALKRLKMLLETGEIATSGQGRTL
ncbi:hypothetical protein SAMN05421641_10210 [Paracoccus thiocyanatus]|uniref:Coenzyme Q-binding protein COQ10 START domain-containing protein n=1 Tax=Paracoccus thiocyanatus TaxID=34006 RepID=A0A1N6NMF0_9RHOB|nr:SRPBCC family protein [Paracoccus thiocyanatus]SIP93187.1 hypothetical protein SAMN05421641_10210 [Paracoccus thiocyanatus]